MATRLLPYLIRGCCAANTGIKSTYINIKTEQLFFLPILLTARFGFQVDAITRTYSKSILKCIMCMQRKASGLYTKQDQSECNDANLFDLMTFTDPT